MTVVAAKKSDLGVRTASAVVMVAVAGLELWLGGLWLQVFVAGIALVGFGEFARLVFKASPKPLTRLAALAAGVAYFGLAAKTLMEFEPTVVALVVGIVVATDVCAYFAGRTIGGPKIAPAISPSKTWAGLAGGMAGAGLLLAVVVSTGFSGATVIGAVFIGASLAVAAQAGDFLESWLKRKAGKKDSSRLIPGHGGVFDRIDGLLPVAIIAGFLPWFSQ